MIIYFAIKYNIIFKYYLYVILLLNFFIFYYIIYKLLIKKINIKTNSEVKYDYLRKLLKTLKNPIILEYQLEQTQKINEKTQKYLYFKKLLSIKLKNDIHYKFIKKKLFEYNVKNAKIDDIIIKLLYINF